MPAHLFVLSPYTITQVLHCFSGQKAQDCSYAQPREHQSSSPSLCYTDFHLVANMEKLNTYMRFQYVCHILLLGTAMLLSAVILGSTRLYQHLKAIFCN